MALVLASTTSHAQQPSEVTEAASRFETATILFNQEDFEGAIVEFQRVFDLVHHVDILYNIAACHDQLNQRERAIEFYERYLTEAQVEPSARPRVERRVNELRLLEAATAPAVSEPVAIEPPTSGVDMRESRVPVTDDPPVLPIIAFGIAGVALITGVVTGILTLGGAASLDEMCGVERRACPPSAQAEIDQTQTLALATDVTLGVSAGAAAIAILALLLGGEEQPPLAAAVSPSSLGIVLPGRF